mmetsp:Transcript_35384/g.94845  ORF Transcript_35384/g.94845 Transcript_35384/m.94845 type:complete len:209 (+) Transcript_35384:260-886(+)
MGGGSGRTAISTLATSRIRSAMGWACTTANRAPNTRGIGLVTVKTVTARGRGLTERGTRVTGRRTFTMVMASTSSLAVRCTRVATTTANGRVKGSTHGLVVTRMRVTSTRTSAGERAVFRLRRVHVTRESGSMIKLTDMACGRGPMEICSKESGRTASGRGTVSTRGRTAPSTTASGRRRKSRGMACACTRACCGVIVRWRDVGPTGS